MEEGVENRTSGRKTGCEIRWVFRRDLNLSRGRCSSGGGGLLPRENSPEHPVVARMAKEDRMAELDAERKRAAELAKKIMKSLQGYPHYLAIGAIALVLEHLFETT